MTEPELIRTVATHLRSPYLCNWDTTVAFALADWLDQAAHTDPPDQQAVETARALAASLGIDTGEPADPWADNPTLAETRTMRAVSDGYPATRGHTLIIPRRHVVGFDELTTQELRDLRHLVSLIRAANNTPSLTLAVNDGPDAGRTIDRFHMHVFPRRPGDVPDPRGGVRQLFYPSPAQDPWIAARGGGEPEPEPQGKPWTHGTRLGRDHRSVRKHLVEDHGVAPEQVAEWSDGAVHGYHDGEHEKTWAYAEDLPHG